MTAPASHDMRRSLFVLLRSTAVSPMVLDHWLAAIQRCIDEDVAPIWGTPAKLHRLDGRVTPPLGAWVVTVLDDCDEPDALGYHKDDLYPSGVVGVKQCKSDNVEISQCLTHEVIELLCDPEANRCVSVGNRVTWLELCDPVEGTPGYVKDEVVCENFIYPNYFRPGSAGPWDHMKALKAPMTILPTGYRVDAILGKGGFQQITGDLARASKVTPHPLSRRGRRITAACGNSWVAAPPSQNKSVDPFDTSDVSKPSIEVEETSTRDDEPTK